MTREIWIEWGGKKDTIRDALCKVLDKGIGVKFQIDADAPARTSAPAQVPVRRPQPAPAAQPQAPAAP